MKREDFLREARKVHTIDYDYSLVEEKILKNSKVLIGCPEHGVFEQVALQHLKGRNCKQCSYKLRAQKRTKEFVEGFLEKARFVHGDFYTYDLSYLESSTSKIPIVCPKHGLFWQSPGPHLQGAGCPWCAGNILTQEKFIERASNIHPSLDFSKVIYVNSSTKVEVVCPKHGALWMTPNNLLSSHGCRFCEAAKKPQCRPMSTNDFIKRAKTVHKGLYSYSRVIYKGYSKKVEITCLKHGPFWQVASYHLSGNGCPVCCASKGELFIENVLREKNADYQKQFTIEGCRNRRLLPFDFVIMRNGEILGCIEYNGGQHYFPVKRWGGEKTFEAVKKRDTIKYTFCLRKRIPLLIIPYYEKNIETLINNFLEKII